MAEHRRERVSVLTRCGIKERTPDKQSLVRQVEAWQAARNENGKTVDWRFTTADARIKLKRLYPEYKC